MNYELSDAQKTIQEKYAGFCTERLAPRAAALDSSCDGGKLDLIRENHRLLAEIGYHGIGHPAVYGGGGCDLASQVIAGEQVAKSCPSTYLSAMASGAVCGTAIALFGSGEQKERYLPGIASGKTIGCFAVTEYESGSDASAIATSSLQRNGAFILNGVKSYVTNAPIADLCVIMARDEGGDISAYIVEAANPGLSAGRSPKTMGLRGAPMGEIVLKNCEIPAGSVLAAKGSGLELYRRMQDYISLFMATGSLGIASAAMDCSNAYSKERKAFGRIINRYQEVSFRLAEMMILSDLARLLTYRAAWEMDGALPEAATSASCAKLFASEAATQISSWAVQIHGGRGYIEGNQAERLYRDARFGEIAGGSAELQRIAIARSVLDRFRD
jgi:alkylation response protein AidB-like acyl-CoA dehydrogenase